jgi:hypothetical protein
MHCRHLVLAKHPAGLARIDILASVTALHQLDIEQLSNLYGGFGHAIQVAHSEMLRPATCGVKA